MPLPSLKVTLLIAIAGLAGCAAIVDRRAQTRESQWMESHPPVGQMVQVGGYDVHVLESGRRLGTAPTVVLIHGANGNLRDFTFDLASRLESQFHVVAVDRPGLGHSPSHGNSDSDPREQARILRAAVQRLGVSNPLIVGHSYGGAVAMGWALLDGERPAGLVILGGATYPWNTPLGGWYRLNRTPLARPSRTLVAGLLPDSAIDGIVASVFEPDPVPEGYIAHLGTGLSMRRSSLEANVRQVNALNGFLNEMQPQYQTLTLPIELVHGDADRTVGLEIHSRPMARDLPNAHLTVLEGVGHMPHHARPEATVAAIRRAAERAGIL